MFYFVSRDTNVTIFYFYFVLSLSSVQVALSIANIFPLLLQCDIWFRDVCVSCVCSDCVYYCDAVQTRLGRLHEGLGGVGHRYKCTCYYIHSATLVLVTFPLTLKTSQNASVGGGPHYCTSTYSSTSYSPKCILLSSTSTSLLQHIYDLL